MVAVAAEQFGTACYLLCIGADPDAQQAEVRAERGPNTEGGMKCVRAASG